MSIFNKSIIFIILNFYSICIVNAKSKIQKQANKRDTIILINKNIVQVENEKKKDSQEFNWEKNMPWLAAIFIGVVTLCGNVYISKKNRIVMEKQIENTTKMSLAQIATAQKNNERDFNKTVLSGNRQIWISEIRDLMTKIIYSASATIIKQNITESEFNELKLLITKSELMLNKQTDQIFLNALLELEKCAKDIILKLKPVETLETSIENIKSLSLAKIQNEWEKVKAGV